MSQGAGARIVLRDAVVNDLDELAIYIQRDSPRAAIRFLEAAEASFEFLARTPDLGGLFETANPLLRGVRIWQVQGFRSILIFYRPIPGGVQIVRVLHGARDFAALFDQEDQPSPG